MAAGGAAGRGGAVAGLVRRVDAAGLDAGAVEALLAAEQAAAAGRLDPAAGVMAQVVLAGCAAPGKRGCWWWRFITWWWTGCRGGCCCPTWQRPGRRWLPGASRCLDRVGTSFRRWARLLADAAGQDQTAGRAGDWWQQVLDGGDPPLGARPLDPPRTPPAGMRRMPVPVPAGLARAADRAGPGRVRLRGP